MTSVAPLALDTSILALYIVGLQKYEPDDFGLLIKILAVYDKFMVTPGVLPNAPICLDEIVHRRKNMLYSQ